jgi:NurA domain-containing protein
MEIRAENPHNYFSKKGQISYNKGFKPKKTKKKSSKEKEKGQNFESSIKKSFLSKERLVSLDLDEHVKQIYERAKDKEEFIKIFMELFCENEYINFDSYSHQSFQPYTEKKLVNDYSSIKFSDLSGLRIVAVDGGLGIRSYLGVQLTLVKSSIVIYEFNRDTGPNITYFPPINQNDNYCFYSDFKQFSEKFTTQIAGLRRSYTENTMLLRYLQKTEQIPDVILLDGSLLPPPPIQLSYENKNYLENYSECVKSYQDLYNLTKEKGIILLGSVKDTHSTKFCELLARSIPFFLRKYKELKPFQELPHRQLIHYFTDSEFFFKILKPRQRSLAFRYDMDIKNLDSKISNSSNQGYNNLHNTNDMNFNGRKVVSEENKEYVFATYLQISPFDLPLRIEFLNQANPKKIAQKVNTIAKILYPLAKMNNRCTLPLPQIEAHLRAHISDEEMEMVSQQLERKFYVKYLSKNNDEIRNNLISYQRFTEDWDKKQIDMPVKTYYSTFLGRRHDRMPF